MTKHNLRGTGGKYAKYPTHADDTMIPCAEHGRTGAHGCDGRMEAEDEFKTFYFADGFETLVPLLGRLEDEFHLEFGLGSNFINAYTMDEALITRIESEIRAWTKHSPHVQLDSVEHGESK